MKKVFEGEKPTLKTLTHLDRCLTCRSCETTCPSGVEYARLLDLGRHFVESRTQRSLYQRLKRNALHWLLTRPRLFARLYRFVATLDPILPHSLRTGAHSTPAGVQVSGKQHTRSILLLQGCVQPAMAPNINTATQKILDKMGINTIILDEIECCGAISHHLNKQARALKTMRNNIDTWWPYIQDGCEAIVSNASGCGITLKEYGQYLDHDPEYAEKARTISKLVKDISELVTEQDIEKIKLPESIKIAFHAPCTLQHGLHLASHVEKLLTQLGCELLPVDDSHLCCGSAGTYSILQPKLSAQLKTNKLDNLQQYSPQYILTANIGCQHHLNSESNVPVRHWVEMVAEYL
jgi:glycolate oxidase iron-sulfur subunit